MNNMFHLSYSSAMANMSNPDNLLPTITNAVFMGGHTPICKFQFHITGTTYLDWMDFTVMASMRRVIYAELVEEYE